MKIEVPPLDEEKLKEAAKEAAMKGALSEIRDYYEGYDSPYRKKIKEELEKQEFSFPISLPDIIAQINETLTAEVNKIANASLTNSFLPMVQKYLLRTEPEMKFSEMLSEFIQHYRGDYEDYGASVEENPDHKWLSVQLKYGDERIDFTLHRDSSSKETAKYKLLSAPRLYNGYSQNEFLSIDSKGVMKVPFTKDMLSNGFTLLCARMMLSDSRIIMDVEDFDEDMFEKECNC